MKYIPALLLAASLVAFADDATKSPDQKPLSEHDQLVIRELQLAATEADDAYQKILAVPEVAKARQTRDDAAKLVGKTATELAEKACGAGARVTEKQENGNRKLYCVAAPAPPSSTPAKK